LLTSATALTRREVAGLAGRFDPISLAEVGAAALMNRTDTRFLVSAAAVPPLLERLLGRYRLLEVNGVRGSGYRTQYFDTPELAFYQAHHSGRRPRHKVRIRSYLDSEERYLEVKLKTNTGRTLKTRALLESDGCTVERVRSEALLHGVGPLPSMVLEPSLLAEFTRLTLVSGDAPERVTVDLDPRFTRGARVLELPELAIVEIKQDRHRRAYAREALRALRVREGALSKYCLGIASLEPGAKRNRFKPALHQVEKLAGAEHPLGPASCRPLRID
jgi:hypothetical protein